MLKKKCLPLMNEIPSTRVLSSQRDSFIRATEKIYSKTALYAAGVRRGDDYLPYRAVMLSTCTCCFRLE